MFLGRIARVSSPATGTVAAPGLGLQALFVGPWAVALVIVVVPTLRRLVRIMFANLIIKLKGSSETGYAQIQASVFSHY